MYISSPLELVVCYVRSLQKMTEAELYTVHKGVYVPTHLHPPESLKYCEEFTFRPDDILIVTYPKSGEFAEFYLFIFISFFFFCINLHLNSFIKMNESFSESIR